MQSPITAMSLFYTVTVTFFLLLDKAVLIKPVMCLPNESEATRCSGQLGKLHCNQSLRRT